MATQRYQDLISRTCKMFLGKENRGFIEGMKLRVLRRRDYPVFSRWALNTITRIVVRERRFQTDT